MPPQDEGHILRQRVRAERDALIDKLARGAFSAENISGGYREITGRVSALDWMEQQIEDVFRSSFPELWSQPPSTQKRE